MFGTQSQQEGGFLQGVQVMTPPSIHAIQPDRHQAFQGWIE